MSITAGQDIVTTDFINESERDATPANDAGRVPQLESDGYLHRNFIRDVSVRVKRATAFQMAAAGLDDGIDWDSEDFDTASMHATPADGTPVYALTTGGAFINLAAVTDWAYQSFTTPNDGVYRLLTRVETSFAGHSGSSHSARLHLRTTAAGSDLAVSENKSFSNPSVPNIATWSFANYVLLPNTTYYMVVEHSVDGGDDMLIETTPGAGGAATSSDSGGSWSGQTYGLNMTIYVRTGRHFVVTEAGKYQIQANINSGTTSNKTLKLWVNQSVIASKVVDGSGAAAGAEISTIYNLAVGDFVLVTLSTVSSGSTDVLAEGSFFSMHRI